MVDDGTYASLRWIPLLPLLAAVAHGFSLGVLRRPLPRAVTIALSCGAPAVSFVVAFIALVELAGMPEGSRLLVDDLFTWIAAGDFGAEFALMLDPLSSVTALLVTGVATLIHFAAIGLLSDDARDDRGFNRFLAYLNLATFSMLTLVLAENLLVMFIGWQGVGLSTVLLVGFWYSDPAATRSSTQAFVCGRLGDAGFLAGTFLLTRGLADAGVSSTAFPAVAAHFGELAGTTVSLPGLSVGAAGSEWELVSLIAGCFALAALSRGAQWPLHVWLPGVSAAAGPVAAMVLMTTGASAGVYLLCRLSFVFVEAPGWGALLAWLGGLTAVLAALAALIQTDLRKVLVALAGVQLGWMFVAAGVGAFAAALFHAVTSAFFMPLLFLAAASILRAARGVSDIHELGGLWNYLHRTKWVFAIGACALVGFPLLSGFYSREGVLLALNFAEEVPRNGTLYVAMLGTVAATAFVAMRLLLRLFGGRCRLRSDIRAQLAEPDASVLIPLYAFSLLSLVGGFLGPASALNPFQVEDAMSNSFANFVSPLLGTGVAEELASGELGLAVLSTFVSATGALLAWYLIHERPDWGARVRNALPVGERLRRLGVAPLYDRGLQPVLWFARRVLDRGIETRLLDRGLMRGSVVALRALATGRLRHMHSGLARDALFWMALGAFAIAAYQAAAT